MTSGRRMPAGDGQDRGMAAAALPTDPAELIRQLDPETIRARIEALDRERDALTVLLRAARRAKPADKPADRGAKHGP